MKSAQFGTYGPIDYQIHLDPDFPSDHWSFWQWGYDAIGLLENTQWEIWGGSYSSYHQPSDTIYHPDLDWEFARHTIRGSLAGLVGLAGLVPEPGAVLWVWVLAVAARPHLRRGVTNR